MKLDNFIIELERNHPNGRYIHPIREYGYQILNLVRHYLKTGNKTSLYIAHEYFKTLSKAIEHKYTL